MLADSIEFVGVSERDIDLLLLEEFLSSVDFLHWFAAQAIGPDFSVGRLLKAMRSVTQSTGESDLEVALEGADGKSVMLLIENKVNAGFQRQQAERYRIRGNTYLERGEYSSFRTVLVAPDRYFGSATELKGFNARITYEAIRDWFANTHSMGARKNYKEGLLTAAIKRGTHGYRPVIDPPVTNFWHMYWQLAQKNAPELEMKEPASKPARAGFIYFHPTNLPIGVDIVHKLRHGNVDLQFAAMGNRLNELRTLLRHNVDPDMKIVKASKSGSVRLRVPQLNTRLDFAKQEEHARQGLDAAKRLLALYIKHPCAQP